MRRGSTTTQTVLAMSFLYLSLRCGASRPVPRQGPVMLAFFHAEMVQQEECIEVRSSSIITNYWKGEMYAWGSDWC